jgi:CHAT domain-containing protein
MVAFYERANGPNHPTVAKQLYYLGEMYRAAGDYEAARPVYERALRIYEQAYGPNHPDVGRSLGGLGALLWMTGDYAAARPLLERSLRIAEGNRGTDPQAVALALKRLAEFLTATGDYASARPLLERAVPIWEQVGDRRHAAAALSDLAEVVGLTGDYARAKLLYERALRQVEEAFGPDHLSVAWSLNDYAGILKLTGDYAGARPLYERALRIQERAFGPNYVWVASTLNNLADLLVLTGDYASAKPLYERALTIARRTAAPEPRWRAASGLGRIYEREGRLPDALALNQEAVRTLEGLASQFREGAARAKYLEAENRLAAYDALARLLLKLHEQDSTKGYDREAFAVLEAKKGRIAAEALTAARPKLQDPKVQQVAEKAQAKQDQILALEKALREEQAKPPKEQQAETIQNLTTLLAQTKAEYLAQVQAFLARYPQYKSQFVDQQTVDPKLLAKFAERLPAGTLAVQYFAAPDALYLFVVAPGGRFQVKRQAVSQAELYGLVKQYRQYIEKAATQRLPWADDRSEAYRREVLPLKELTRKLAGHLLAPIEAELKTHQNLILIPNDLLLYLPFQSLTRPQPDESVRFLAESHAISILTQLELVDILSPAQPAANTPLLALANPDGTLPGASREVRALQRIRPAVTALEGLQATKAQFLIMVPQFPDLHLATHGVLDSERPERSYLLLAGTGEAGQRLGIDEIAGLSLRNGLAILSACETALGEQVPGAALITLAAAFSQAGSQSIVASLWKVNDASTRDFMVAFHRAVGTTAGPQHSSRRKSAFSAIPRPPTPTTGHPSFSSAPDE